MRMTGGDRDALNQAAWATALRMQEFSYYSLAAEAHLRVERVTALVKDWEKSGGVVFKEIGALGKKIYKVVEGKTALPARRRSDGTAAPAGNPTGNMWRSMRVLKAFNPIDLQAMSSTPEVYVTLADAQAYCQMLTRASYLRVVQKALPGRRQATYRLIKDTGPRPPVERRVRAVYDENLDKVVHITGVTS